MSIEVDSDVEDEVDEALAVSISIGCPSSSVSCTRQMRKGNSLSLREEIGDVSTDGSRDDTSALTAIPPSQRGRWPVAGQSEEVR